MTASLWLWRLGMVMGICVVFALVSAVFRSIKTLWTLTRPRMEGHR